MRVLTGVNVVGRLESSIIRCKEDWEYCRVNKTMHLFAKEYPPSLTNPNIKHARYYVAQDLQSFFDHYSSLAPHNRFYEVFLSAII